VILIDLESDSLGLLGWDVFYFSPRFFSCCIVDMAVTTNDNKYWIKGIGNIDVSGNQSWAKSIFRFPSYASAGTVHPCEANFSDWINFG